MRRKERLRAPDGHVGITDAELLALWPDVDPYQTYRVWRREETAALVAGCEAHIRRARAEALEAVLRETRQPLLTQRAEALLALLERARGEDGTVILFGD